jgi:dihydrofolate reductase
VEAVVAIDQLGGIGKGGWIPWDLPEDLKLFHKLTLGKTVVMGGRTWESLPPSSQPLPGRTNIVMTRHRYWCAAGALRADEVGVPSNAVVIGGAEIYAALMPAIDVLHVSHVDGDFECDTFFPATPASLGFVADEPFYGFQGFHYRRYLRAS